MSRIRLVEIKNFRAISELEFIPADGINCFIGPGDSGKSSILDAIDLCLGARRTAQFFDTDFHNLNVDQLIEISLTIGKLDDSLKNIDQYGQYLRGYDKDSGTLSDEPESGLETVLTLKLEVGSDLEPSWLLYSDRAAAQGLTRGIQWGDRVKLAPTRIGAMAQHNLGWQRGSVLNRISDERADASATLAKAAREARAAFGDKAAAQLGDALKIVGVTANELGIPIGDNVKALLDAHSVSFVGGTISLHDAGGVPLRGLGVGSTRLLIAGLQRKAAEKSSIILVDELEHGLEPHRIIRLLGSLGAKDKNHPLQVFATTHSPVALRELSGAQLIVVRRTTLRSVTERWHQRRHSGNYQNVARCLSCGSVLICEGASEVGIVRGIDQYRASIGEMSIFASGVGLVDAGGEKKIYARVPAFSVLGYRCGVLRDDDVPADANVEGAFTAAGGQVFKWEPGQALEQAIFSGVSEAAIQQLVAKAVDDLGATLIDAHIKQASNNKFDLASCSGRITDELRGYLGSASKSKAAPWFKSVSKMEEVGHDIIGPDLEKCRPEFASVISSLFQWAAHVQP